MRILHLIPSLSAGGAERQLSYLAPELVRIGHDVHIAYSNEGPEKPALKGVALHRLKSLSNYDPYLLWQMIKLIRQIRPDIIQTWIPQMDILGGMAAKLCGTPFIFREPCSGLEVIHMWKNYLRVRLGSGASAIISNSLGGYEYWRTIMPDGRHHFVSNALPLDEIDAIQAAFPQEINNPEVPIVLYAGRIVKKQKRPKLFLEAIAQVRKKKNVLGVLCGDGPQLSEMKNITHELGLDADIIFTGYLPITSVWALMKKASVLVSTSAYEGCPNTVMEAMACACPLVISDIQSHREILDDHCALFVNPLNIQQTADTIIKILNNTDEAKKRAFSAKQRTSVWSIAEMAIHYERVYKGCL